jgi:hypothetical protein
MFILGDIVQRKFHGSIELCAERTSEGESGRLFQGKRLCLCIAIRQPDESKPLHNLPCSRVAVT